MSRLADTADRIRRMGEDFMPSGNAKSEWDRNWREFIMELRRLENRVSSLESNS